jgi:peroxiredoxin
MAVAPPRIRWRALLGAVLAAVVTGCAAGCSTGKDAVDPASGGENGFVAGEGTGKLIPAGERQAAPSFQAAYLGGESFDSTSLSGKIVVLNFWGSWCAPCRVETPEFNKVYEQVRGQGVEFLGVAVRDTEQGAQAFYTNKKIGFRSLFDPAGRVALTFRAIPPSAIPSTVILDRHGRIADVHVGTMLSGDLWPVLERLVAES